jgi:hypothetical protein
MLIVAVKSSERALKFTFRLAAPSEPTVLFWFVGEVPPARA